MFVKDFFLLNHKKYLGFFYFFGLTRDLIAFLDDFSNKKYHQSWR